MTVMILMQGPDKKLLWSKTGRHYEEEKHSNSFLLLFVLQLYISSSWWWWQWPNNHCIWWVPPRMAPLTDLGVPSLEWGQEALLSSLSQFHCFITKYPLEAWELKRTRPPATSLWVSLPLEPLLHSNAAKTLQYIYTVQVLKMGKTSILGLHRKKIWIQVRGFSRSYTSFSTWAWAYLLTLAWGITEEITEGMKESRDGDGQGSWPW